MKSDLVQTSGASSQSAAAPRMPMPVSGLDMAFGGAMEKLMPRYDTIPAEFKRSSNPWCRVVSQWFFGGLKGVTFTPKEGIDKTMALRHVASVIGSFEPKHEHKEAACAYLLSLWFERVEGGDFGFPKKGKA